MASSPEEAASLLASCSTQSQHLIGSVSALLAINAITTVFRLHARWLTGRSSFGWDDAFACSALVALIVEATLLIINSKAQMEECRILIFNEEEPIGSGPNVTENMTIYAASIVYQIACTLAKLSICFLYLRVLRDKVVRLLSIGTIVFLILSCIAFTVPFILFCTPPSAYWSTTTTGHCLNFYALEVSRSVPHIVTDVFMLFLPLPVISKLQVSRKRRWGILATFATATVGLIGCCARLGVYAKQYQQSVSNQPELGIAWEINTQLRLVVDNHIFTFVEPAMYLLAANLPPLRALLVKLKQRMGATTWLQYRFPTTRYSRFRRSRRTPRRDQFVEMQDSPQVPRTPSRPQLKPVTNPMVTRFGEELEGEVHRVGEER